MIARTLILAALASLTISAPSLAASKQNPMGIAIGNVLIGDYGAKSKVTGAFDADGTVALTFPDGTKRRQAWVADANYFCMIVMPAPMARWTIDASAT